MTGKGGNLPSLLLLSGIDLLLAALCAAVGILVLLIGTNTAAHERTASMAAKPFQDWSLVYVNTGSLQRHELICDGIQQSAVSHGPPAIYVVRLPAGPNWKCVLAVGGTSGTDGATVKLITADGRQHLPCQLSDVVLQAVTITHGGFSPDTCVGPNAAPTQGGAPLRLDQEQVF